MSEPTLPGCLGPFSEGTQLQPGACYWKTMGAIRGAPDGSDIVADLREDVGMVS